MIKKIKNWEQWPFQVLYAPLAPAWLWYMIRSGAVWFFTPSNPKLTFGGLDGEPKREMHELLPPELCPDYFNVTPAEPFSAVKAKLAASSIRYPLIVKPEIGGKGILFRKIDDEKQLQQYHSSIPVEYFIQEYIQYPMEVSLFYYRYPDQNKGVITGFLQKVPMRVTGDGVHNLGELLLQNVKTKKRLAELKQKHEINFNNVLPPGEIYHLSHAANHNRGADFFDLASEISPELVDVLDKISHKVDDFFYGRYDIMCSSVEELKRGENFAILEYNGCGAEPNHFYDTGYTLVGAWREILKHWKVLFRISRHNHKNGVSYWPFIRGLRFRHQTRKYYKLINKVDKEIP